MTLTGSSRPSRRPGQVRGESVIPTDERVDVRPRLLGPALLGILAGLQAALAGLVLVIVATLVLWLGAAEGGSVVLNAVRDSGMLWLAGHHTRFTVDSGSIQLAPLGLTLLLGGIAWWFARRVARVLALEDADAGDAVRAHAGFVGAYTVVGLVVSLLAATHQVRPQPETALPGLIVFSALAVAVPLHRRGAGSWRRPAVSRTGALLRAGLSALVLPAALGILLVAGLLAAGSGKVGSIYSALHPGALGSVGLALIHLALLPNVLVWLLSWFAGPGFQVGVGTSVTAGHTVLGPLPALPLLGILPAPGRHGAWLGWLAVAVVVAAGVFGGRFLNRWHDDTAPGGRTRLADVGLAALVTTVGAALLSWWTSGPVGGGVMAWWGIASPWFPLAFGALTGIGMLLAVVAGPVTARARSRRHTGG